MRNTGKVEWKSLAVANEDPHEFAAAFAAALQEMANEGYNVINQITRNSAIIITGQRVDSTETPLLPASDSSRTYVVEMTKPSNDGTIRNPRTREVTYYFMQGGQQMQRTFPALEDAVQLLREHLGQTEDVVPIAMADISVRRYEAEDFSTLLRSFPEESRKTKPVE